MAKKPRFVSELVYREGEVVDSQGQVLCQVPSSVHKPRLVAVNVLARSGHAEIAEFVVRRSMGIYGPWDLPYRVPDSYVSLDPNLSWQTLMVAVAGEERGTFVAAATSVRESPAAVTALRSANPMSDLLRVASTQEPRSFRPGRSDTNELVLSHFFSAARTVRLVRGPERSSFVLTWGRGVIHQRDCTLSGRENFPLPEMGMGSLWSLMGLTRTVPCGRCFRSFEVRLAA